MASATTIEQAAPPSRRSLSERWRAEVSEAVARRRIRYEVCREYEGRGRGLRTVGFQILLTALHHDATHRPWPGCVECRSTIEDLKRLALCVVPVEDREAIYEVVPDERALRYSRVRGLRPEVGLRLRVLVRHRPVGRITDLPSYRLVVRSLEGLGVGRTEQTSVGFSSTVLANRPQEGRVDRTEKRREVG